ncbi:tryptophan--tRNA ligase [Mesomycoplasma lagogenitalium]|uniref:Tryptophan--tRNA ligase n=1 Tax=Mesomycoplasma lagogenitalium TaxID=171286 RepID=A0ABY8LSX1_9BACT|nr:tryptophan--tRNA ligase [Mesomycoplasma lagogenitalium]WGI36354.1 tryptophan--tRNA ligase [Mesomycoplasma lagogenitalium]
MKERLVSGIQATGKLTLGNYIGAIKNSLELQEKYQMMIFIADLHTITLPISKEELAKNREEVFALYLASGIDPEKSIIFYQSDVQEHTTMNWYVLVNTTMGELSRMTQFKDKSNKVKLENGTYSIPTGLLIYPTLMAADILLYNPKVVTVGIDQTQHVELTRNIALRLNKKYKMNFNNVETHIPKIGAKIMGLVDPTKKMSKSNSNLNDSIFLLDDPNVAYKKILKAVTDSENKVYISESKPGILNLLTIYSCLTDTTLEETEILFKDKNYKEFKEAVALKVKEFLTDLQSKYQEARKKVNYWAKIGQNKAQKIAQNTIIEIKKGMGL